MKKLIFTCLTALSTAASANLQLPFRELSAQNSLVEIFSADDGSKWFMDLRLFAIFENENGPVLITTFHRVPASPSSPVRVGLSAASCAAGGGTALVRLPGAEQGVKIEWKRTENATVLIDALASTTCITYDEFLKLNQPPAKPSSGSNRGMTL